MSKHVLTTGQQDRHVQAEIDINDQVSQDELRGILEHQGREYDVQDCCAFCKMSFEFEAPAARLDIWMTEAPDGVQQYAGTDVVCASCAREPYKVIKTVRVYLSDKHGVRLFHCENIYSPIIDGKIDESLN